MAGSLPLLHPPPESSTINLATLDQRLSFPRLNIKYRLATSSVSQAFVTETRPIVRIDGWARETTRTGTDVAFLQNSLLFSLATSFGVRYRLHRRLECFDDFNCLLKCISLFSLRENVASRLALAFALERLMSETGKRVEDGKSDE